MKQGVGRSKSEGGSPYSQGALGIVPGIHHREIFRMGGENSEFDISAKRFLYS